MTVMMTIQILCTLAALVYIIFILTNESSRRYSLLTAAVMSSFAGSLGYIMTLSCNNTDAALAVTSFGIMGAAFSHYLIYSFCMDHCGIKKLDFLSMILLAANIIGIAMAVLTGKMGLFYKSFEMCSCDTFFVPKTEYGLGAYILTAAMIVQSAVIAVSAVYVFRRQGAHNGKHMPEMCAAAMLPAAAKIAAGMGLFGGFDLSYIFIVLGCLLISANVYNGKVMEVVNSARDNIIETMNDALLVTDTKMNIVDANPAARLIFPDLLRVGRKTQEMVSLIAELMDEGADHAEFEINGKCYDKHISKLSNSDGSPMGYAVLLLDVTDTKRYVDDLIDMRQRADMANSAKSDFLANMSHEIRTPMNAITGFAELCLREKNYQYAADIKAAAKNLIAIINDILDISKIEAGKLELVPSVYSVEDMLNDVISLVYVQLDGKSGIEFKIDIDKRLPKKLYGDEVRIKQILINLLGNSVKFTKAGYVGLSVREISRNGDMSDIMIKVTDTGIGIKREDMSKLFSNFQQVDTKKNREIEGTGLGLSITKNLVEMMNGTVTVDSEYGKGSTFTVVLQQKIEDSSHISVEAAKAAPVTEEKSTVLYAPDAKVLIVDDNQVNLKVTAQLLSQYGIKCSAADSGKKAIEMVRSGYYDLVFMDHMMPELDGVDTTKIIRSQGDAYSKGLPIIALTANAVSGAKEMFLESGLNDFISKPIQRPQLEKILAKWLPAKLVSYVGAKKSSSSYNDSLELLGIIEDTSIPEADSGQIDDFLIPNVDVKAGLELCGGNPDAYIAVMKTFVETAEESILRIETYAQNRNYKDYTTEVHGLKSSSLSIGAKELSEMARQLEMAGRSEDYKQIMYDTPTLIARYTDIVEHIRPFVETEKQSGASEAGKPPVDTEILKAKLGEVLEAVDNLDSPEAINILDELMEFSFPTEKISEEIENARRYADNFAYEKAEAAVRHVLEII